MVHVVLRGGQRDDGHGAEVLERVVHARAVAGVSVLPNALKEPNRGWNRERQRNLPTRRPARPVPVHRRHHLPGEHRAHRALHVRERLGHRARHVGEEKVGKAHRLRRRRERASQRLGQKPPARRVPNLGGDEQRPDTPDVQPHRHHLRQVVVHPGGGVLEEERQGSREDGGEVKRAFKHLPVSHVYPRVVELEHHERVRV